MKALVDFESKSQWPGVCIVKEIGHVFESLTLNGASVVNWKNPAWKKCASYS